MMIKEVRIAQALSSDGVVKERNERRGGWNNIKQDEQKEENNTKDVYFEALWLPLEQGPSQLFFVSAVRAIQRSGAKHGNLRCVSSQARAVDVHALNPLVAPDSAVVANSSMSEEFGPRKLP